MAERQDDITGEEGHTNKPGEENNPVDMLISDFQFHRFMEINLCCVDPQSVIFCYGRFKRLMQ